MGRLCSMYVVVARQSLMSDICSTVVAMVVMEEGEGATVVVVTAAAAAAAAVVGVVDGSSKHSTHRAQCSAFFSIISRNFPSWSRRRVGAEQYCSHGYSRSNWPTLSIDTTYSRL